MKTAFLAISLCLCCTSATSLQAQNVSGSVVKCSTDGGQTWRTNCDDPPTAGAAASGLNPAVASAANQLGQLLGRALLQAMFSRPSSPTQRAVQLDTAAAAAAMRRAQFAHDKNTLMAELGLNENGLSQLSIAGGSSAHLQMAAPPASGELHMVDASAPSPSLTLAPPALGPTPPDVVATIHLRVGETSLLMAAPKNAAGVEIPFAVCSFSTDNAGVVTVNQTTGQVTAVGPGAARIIETCNGARAAVSVAVRPRLLNLRLLKAGDADGRLSATSTGRDFESGMYEQGALVTVTADPITIGRFQSTFGGWAGPCESQTATTCTLTMNANKIVTATFNPIPRAPR